MRRYSSRKRNRVIKRLLLASMAVSALYLLYLNFQITTRFDGSRWEIPSRVYARPMEVHIGKTISQQDFVKELQSINYHRTSLPLKPGEYHIKDSLIYVKTREFQFWDETEPEREIRIEFSEKTIQGLIDDRSGMPIDILRIEPMFIGSIYPRRHEDRVLVKLEDVPDILVKSLLLIEDKQFYEHSGISPKSIFRALLANLRAGEKVQGGSTITQQLVKNYFLSNDKSYWRKINEAIMSLMLELHYSKDEIIEAYINEIYLGQEGNRAIHGFGLASWFYFSKPLGELNPPEIALLVAMVKGASYYDPRRSKARSQERRNLVLKVMADEGLITQKDFKTFSQFGLNVIAEKPKGITPFPAFLDLVKRQLAEDYDENDLKTAGLRIFSTLDPLIQRQSEEGLTKQIQALERNNELESGKIESAVIISRRHSAEVQAVIGGKNVRFSGLNRAVDINRSIGSLVKPAIYLEALSRPNEYHLASLLNDSEIELDMGGGKHWRPGNYDGEFHGEVPMYRALAKSYNLAAVQLGLELGIDKVNERINTLGVSRSLNEYPANLLGAIELSPIEVAQMFQTLADGGYYTPLRAIRSVTNSHGEALQRYAIETRKVVDDASAFLINVGLQNVVQAGTAKSLSNYIDKELYVAGKTGTTNDKRDSWFAGFSQQYVGVAWLGHDDFTPTVFTGSSGAMKVWGSIIEKLETKPLMLTKPESVVFLSVDPESGLHVSSDCAFGIDLPINVDTFVGEEVACRSGGLLDRTQQWLNQLF